MVLVEVAELDAAGGNGIYTTGELRRWSRYQQTVFQDHQ
jgi:hypothetical protein